MVFFLEKVIWFSDPNSSRIDWIKHVAAICFFQSELFEISDKHKLFLWADGIGTLALKVFKIILDGVLIRNAYLHLTSSCIETLLISAILVYYIEPKK